MTAHEEMIEDLREGLANYFPPDPAMELTLVADLAPQTDPEQVDELGRPTVDTSQFVRLEDAVVLEAGARSAVAWRYHGVDTLGVNGLAPTGSAVVIRGVTLYDQSSETFQRYIDWLDVYTQLGMSLIGRAVIEPPPVAIRAQ